MYKGFVDSICEDVENAFFNMNDKDVEVTPGFVNKLGGDSYYGITARPAFEKYGVSLDLQEFFEAYQGGAEYNDIVYNITARINEALNSTPDVEAELLQAYSNISDRIMIRLVPTKNNEEMLKKLPHREIGDVSITYSIVFNKTEKGDYTSVFSNDLAENFGVTEEDLWQDTIKNAPVSFPASIRSLTSVIAEMTGENIDASDTGAAKMYVATCNDSVHGAGCIFYPGLLKKHVESVGHDLFILPSSVHEVLLIADDGNNSYEDLELMVRSVNGEIDSKDFLSDTVYHYDAKEDKIETAEEFVNRTKEGGKDE